MPLIAQLFVFAVPVFTAVAALCLIAYPATRRGGYIVYAMALVAICRTAEITFTRPGSMDAVLGRVMEVMLIGLALPTLSILVFWSIAAVGVIREWRANSWPTDQTPI